MNVRIELDTENSIRKCQICKPVAPLKTLVDAFYEGFAFENVLHMYYRFLATAMLQPYSKKALKATDVVKFPWDDKAEEAPKGTSSRERMEEVRKRIGK